MKTVFKEARVFFTESRDDGHGVGWGGKILIAQINTQLET